MTPIEPSNSDPDVSVTSAGAVPLAVSGRSEWLDALRGFALLGIVIYNIQVFGGFAFRGLLPATQRAAESLDPLLDFLAHVLIQGKFYSLFSFLFGLGLMLQLQRLQASGAQAMPVLRRRLWWLLAFGLAHAVLVWFGDILTVYAVFGFALLALRHLSQRALLASALALLASPVVIYLVYLAVGLGDPLAGDPSVPAQQSPIAVAVRTVAEGSYGEVVRTNLGLYPLGWARRAVQLSLPRILGMFLLGAWAARAGLPSATAQLRPLLRSWLVCAVVVGIPLNLAFTVMGDTQALFPVAAKGLLAAALAAAGMPLLCLGYVAAFALYWTRPRPRSLLVAAGRTALSQYLGQSIACVALFYGFGLGLLGQLSYTGTLPIAALVFLGLAIGARAWLQRYPQGPMELLWRRLSYGGARARPRLPQETA